MCCILLGTSVEEIKRNEAPVFGKYNHIFEICIHVFEIVHDYLRLTLLKLCRSYKLLKDEFYSVM